MICKKCGATVPEGSVYCNACGAEIQIVPEYSILENDILDSYIGVTLRVPEETEEDPKKKKPQKPVNYSGRFYRNIAITVAVVAVLVVIVSVFVWRYASARRLEDSSYDFQMAEAIRYYEARDYEMAVAHFDKALVVSPDDPQVLIYLARCYENLGELSAAANIYRSLIDLDPDQLSYYEDLVRIYEAEGDYDKIRTLFGLSEDESITAFLNEYAVEAPTFSLSPGTYYEDIEISIEGADMSIIYYTTDGSDPIGNGLIYNESIKFEGEGRYLLKAVSQNTMNLYSNVAEAEYVIKYETPDRPTVSLPSGVYQGPQVITVTVPEGCSAYYTLDGTTPTVRSFRYETPIVLPGVGEYVISLVTISSHGKVSDTSVFTYLVVE